MENELKRCHVCGKTNERVPMRLLGDICINCATEKGFEIAEQGMDIFSTCYGKSEEWLRQSVLAYYAVKLLHDRNPIKYEARLSFLDEKAKERFNSNVIDANVYLAHIAELAKTGSIEGWWKLKLEEKVS